MQHHNPSKLLGTPGSRARSGARNAEARTGEATAREKKKEKEEEEEEEESRRGSRAAGSSGHSPGLWPPAADAGFLAEPRSFFLLLSLPLPSLRSDISPGEATELKAYGAVPRGEGDEFGPRGGLAWIGTGKN